jgi:uncharacterized protein YnzC (UPF0291/DUF896 family)
MEDTSTSERLGETGFRQERDDASDAEDTQAESEATPDVTPAKADETKTYDQNYVDKLRREGQKKGAEISTLKERIAALEAEKTDEVESVRAEYRLRSSKDTALKALESAKVVDPELAFGLIEGRIEFDGDTPKNLDAVVKEFVASHPRMVAVTLPDTQSTSPDTDPASRKSSRPAGRL